MKKGHFNQKGELFFQMDLMAVDNSMMTVDAMLDTGFTDWLAMNIQDIECLEWPFIMKREKQTASGMVRFSIYAGTVFFDDHEFTIPVIGGGEFTHILMGLQWLGHRRLIVDRKMDLLTLENVN
jgi:predicted aspartyl protease